MLRGMSSKSAIRPVLYTNIPLDHPTQVPKSIRHLAPHQPIAPPATRPHHLLKFTKSPSPLTIELKEEWNTTLEVVPPRQTNTGARKLPGFPAVLRHPDVSESIDIAHCHLMYDGLHACRGWSVGDVKRAVACRHWIQTYMVIVFFY